jgi:hypothetical protein
VTLEVMRAAYEKGWSPKRAINIRTYIKLANPPGVVHTMALAGLANPWDIYHLMAIAVRTKESWKLTEEMATQQLPSRPKPEYGVVILWKSIDEIEKDALASLPVVELIRYRFKNADERKKLIQGIYEAPVRDVRNANHGPVVLLVVRIDRPKYVVRVTAGTKTTRDMDPTLFNFKTKWRGTLGNRSYLEIDKVEANLIFYTFGILKYINPTVQRVVREQTCQVVEFFHQARDDATSRPRGDHFAGDDARPTRVCGVARIGAVRPLVPMPPPRGTAARRSGSLCVVRYSRLRHRSFRVELYRTNCRVTHTRC